MWAPSLLIAHGTNPYSFHLIENPPYTMSPYGPISYLLFGAGLRIFGLQFQSGRAIALVALLICAVCIAWLTHALTRRKRFALLSVAFFWSQLPVLYWVGVQRPDFLALAFGLSAICIAVRVLDDAHVTQKWRLCGITICAVLTVGAVLTRLTTLLSFFTILWLCHQFKAQHELRFFLLGTIGLFAGIVWALNFTSDGGFWWQQWTMANTAPKSFDNAKGQLALLLSGSPATILAVLLVAVAWYKERRASASVPLRSTRAKNILATLRWSAMAAFLVAFVTVSRAGADLNYWLEASAYLSIVAAASWPRLADEAKRVWRLRYGFCLATLTLCATLPTLRMWQGEQFRWASLPYLRRIVAAIEQNSAPRDPCFGLFVDLIYAAHRTPFFNDPVQYDTRSPLHALLERALQQRRFAAIVSRSHIRGYHLLKLRSETRLQYVWLYIRNKETTKTKPQSSTRTTP